MFTGEIRVSWRLQIYYSLAQSYCVFYMMFIQVSLEEIYHSLKINVGIKWKKISDSRHYMYLIMFLDCGGSKVDIVFILDSSGSVGKGNFEKTKEFFKTMVGGFQIGPNDVRMASVTFSTVIHDTFQFSEYNSVESLRNRVLNIPYDSGGTNTQLALKYARVTSFSYARSGVSKIAVVITDGKSNSKPKTLDEAEKLRNSSVIIFSVGVGSGVDRTELEGMASKATYVFDVATFNALESIRERLTKTACEGRYFDSI